MKFVMAIVVVAIHTRPEWSFNSSLVKEIFESIYSIAVPFFFMASGFLLFRKISLPLDKEGEKRIKTYIKRIVKLYLIWTLIYLPLSIYGFYLDGMPILKSIAVFFRNILLIGENYMSWPLWYLLALIVAVGIIYILLKIRVPENWIVVISVIMAIIGLGLDYCKENSILQPVTDMYFSVFQKTRNGFFVGFLYVALGLLCSRFESMPLMWIIITFILGLVGVFCKIPLLNILLVFSLFVITISLEISFVRFQQFSYLRVLSSIFFLIHMYFVTYLIHFTDINNGLLMFFMVVLFSTTLGICLMRCKTSRLFKVLFY